MEKVNVKVKMQDWMEAGTLSDQLTVTWGSIQVPVAVAEPVPRFDFTSSGPGPSLVGDRRGRGMQALS